MTAAEIETDTPVVLIVSATELKHNAGKVWREVAAGAAVRVDDVRTGVTLAWISATAPAGVADVLPFLPEPGAAADRLGPEE